MVGITMMMRFVESSSSGFSDFLDYIAREEAVDPFAYSEYVSEYMDNPEKTYGLFTENSDSLTEGDREKMRECFADAQDKGSLLWQSVLSFDNRWLSVNGIYDFKTETLDEEKMRACTRAAMRELFKRENMEGFIYAAAIHKNTDNIHVHIAIADPEPVWKEGAARCYKNRKGELKQRGKFKGKSIAAVKSRFTSEVFKGQPQNVKINEIMRGRLLSKENDFSMKENIQLRTRFIKLAESLPDDLRLLKYNNNAMKAYRAEIDSLSKQYVDKYHREEMQELRELIRIQDERYRITYGNSGQGRSFAQNKEAELNERLGNSILSAIREYKIIERQSGRKKGSSSRKTSPKSAYYPALRTIRKSMYKDIQSMKNQSAYEELRYREDNEIT